MYRNVVVDDDVFCVVCDVVYVLLIIMIFVKMICFLKWLIEYVGVLIVVS